MGSWAPSMASVAGMRPPPVTDVEPGEWAHGWQHYAFSALPTRRILVLGRPKSWSDAPPSLSSILEGLRLPLLVCEVRCECGLLVDGHGRHRAACPLRQVAHSSLSTRMHTRQSVPGGRSVSSLQREVGGHECSCVRGRKRGGGARVRSTTFPRGSTCGGHHAPECSDSDRIASFRRSSGGRHRVHGGQG